MSLRSKGPLYKLQLQGDDIKKKISGFEEVLKNDEPDAEECKNIYEECVQLKIHTSSMLLECNNLQEGREVGKITNFATKKDEEMQRIQALQKKLNDIMDKIEAMSTDPDGLRTLRSTGDLSSNKNRDVVEGETDEEIDEDEEYDETDDEYEDSEKCLYVVLHAYTAEQEEDLSIEVDDIVLVLQKHEDGWWEVKDEDGKVGLVPSNFLQEYHEEDEENTLKEDTGVPTIESEGTSAKSGMELWKGIKDAVNEPVKTDVTDVLAALGALPAGFRPSTMTRLMQENDVFTLRNAILPSFTKSNISLQDVHWDPTLNQIRALPTRVLRSCRLWSCRMIPLAGTGVDVLSRHIRLSLFDGTNFLSNIHTVRAGNSASNPKTWTFSPRVSGILPSLLDGACTVRSDITHSNLGILFELAITYIRKHVSRVIHCSDGPLVKYVDEEENNVQEAVRPSTNVESVISYCNLQCVKIFQKSLTSPPVQATSEKSELSCGWVFLKLFDEQGNAIPNKTYELMVNGGTPFEKGVEVDPSISRRAATTNRFRALLMANKQPKLVIKLGVPNNTKKKYLNLLPANVILPSSYCELVSYYRRMLADALIRDRISNRDADPISCPILSSFPDAIMQADIMDGVRSAWGEKIKTLRRGDKRDKENMKSIFKNIFLETGYVLLHTASLPPPLWANPQIEEERWMKIFRQLQINKPVPTATNTAVAGKPVANPAGVLKTLLAPNIEHEPFDLEELNFNLLKDNSKMLVAI